MNDTVAGQPKFKLYSVEDLEDLPDPKWLIEGILPEAGLAELYGAPGVGKSFLVLDWALSIASGTLWLGHEIVRGDTVYICAEGGAGIKKRIKAWCSTHRGAELDGFRVLPQPVDMLTGRERKDMIKAIGETFDDPRLVIIDTLARCFGDGDENSTKDMNKFVQGLDRIKNAFQHATVLIVHHTGKDAKRKDRGNSALRGAADTVLVLAATKGNPIFLKCDKQKDSESFKDIRLAREIVLLHKGETSCVIVPTNLIDEPFELDGNSSDFEALGALKKFGAEGARFAEWMKASDLPASTFKNVIKRLVPQLVCKVGKRYVLVDRDKGQGQG